MAYPLMDELMAEGQVPPEILQRMEQARAPQMGWQQAGGPPAQWQEAPSQKMSDVTGGAFAPTVADLYPNPAMAQAFLKSRGYDPNRVQPWQVPLQGNDEKLYRDRAKTQMEAANMNRQLKLLEIQSQRAGETERHNRQIEAAKAAAELRASQAKPLPNPLREGLAEATAASEGMAQQRASFKNAYGDSVILGPMENVLKRWFPSLETMTNTEGQADWWSAMTGIDNIIRHPLFGSAFTTTEKSLWRETSVNPRDSADLIKKNLERRAVVLNRAMKRLVESAGVRYDPDEIEALTGQRPTKSRGNRPPLGQIFKR